MAKTKGKKMAKLTKSQQKAIRGLTTVITDSNRADSFSVNASKRGAIVMLWKEGKRKWNDWYTVGRRGAVAHCGNA